ncbi:MAG: DNA mismatch repair endonuclease MutL [Kiritimatiellaeota bacterium]|nr:DNA mismatch repair endonuclease MutL [Kiritimatiellota bacterium]
MPTPKPIRVLSDHVINKIAAGEVVERPASVIKELVENALDSGATQIEVEAVGGGRQLVAITDNGCGMGHDDALLSIERHATSKILDVDDIEHVATLGFRGEALAAISAVSHFTLTTRPAADEGGTEVTVVGGKLSDVKDTGSPPGTRIEVRRLFFNVPARRKFLRADQTELAHIRQMFVVYALAHPEVGWRLVVDGREVMRLAAGATLADRLREIVGAELSRQLRPLDFTRHDVTVRGYAGLPSAARQDRTEQYIFVNGRPASAPAIFHAINEGYHTLMPPGRHAPIFLFIEVDPEQVDVNVHPTKKEVRFRQPGAIRDAVIEAIRQALQPSHTSGIPNSLLTMPPPPTPTALPTETQTKLLIPDLPPLRTFSFPGLPMLPSAPATAETDATTPRPAVSPKTSAASPWLWCRVLGQVGGLYVVLETEDGLVLMDPHAAHERVLFEQLLTQYTSHSVKSQGLLAPETVELLPAAAEVVRDNLSLLREMGFGLAEFGGDAFIVDAIPACLGGVAPHAVLSAVAESLAKGGARGGDTHWVEEAVAQAACKAAVKARDVLRLDEIEQLVVALARAAMPYTCPHGRPTIIFTSYGELHRKFGRA